jgi:pyruvate kinase
VLELKNLIEKKKGHAGVVAKIEKPEALKEIDQIIDLADAVMVARGDLGVEIPFDEVPLIQKLIVGKCNLRSKPVIIATQMMESMITNFRPTRAEANDVANAVLDGADALMLSGETSVGKYPVETIASMQSIIAYTENHGDPFNKQYTPEEETSTFLADSICSNASQLAQQVKANAIVVFTHSGYTAIRISSHRPKAKIYAFTSDKKLLNKISMVWGIQPFYLSTYDDLDKSIQESIEILKAKKLLTNGDCVVHVGSTPLHLHGRTNMMKASKIYISENQ